MKFPIYGQFACIRFAVVGYCKCDYHSVAVLLTAMRDLTLE